ncbi:hypothetical protein A2881_02770 [Candidatus Peribacteria bacterium RIFCSPHIGHO2_01_FULL_55_13]|nr:MAG: hypothetical protein A2881_02770 [Candidatus Peribacteria bacterium RIFCSPHIGHO2_01_FULL_55_13]OGJ66558.1 MAG: hypothetical protein A3F36_02920 [Candidatus Peribacteria bacterium RIFCSPHIGHO2_12_FULL_55_11]
MHLSKELLGGIGVGLTLIGYAFYFHDIFFGRTKPHAFSWFLWALLAAIGFAAQVTGQAGPGAWAIGLDAVVCSIMFVLALFKGEKGYVLSDWIALFATLAAILLWRITGTPVLSVILIVIIDAFAFYPTVRKSVQKPYEEAASLYALCSLKFVFVLLALEHYSLITALYPFCLIFMNAGFVALLMVRRTRMAH